MYLLHKRMKGNELNSIFMFNSESIISLIKFNSATFLRKLFSNINSVKESLLFSSHNNFENKFFNSSLFI